MSGEGGLVVLDTLLLENNNIPGSQMTAEQFTAGAAGIYKAEINIQAETAAGAERRVWLTMSGATLEYSQMRARYIKSKTATKNLKIQSSPPLRGGL